jgi:anti-sigma regulatory factor (Ser/Thr protein kinase)
MNGRSGATKDTAAARALDGGTGEDRQVLLRLSALDLRPLPGAVPSARLHARAVLREWGMAAVARDAELVVAELLSNAIRAAVGAAGRGGEPQPVRLRLTGRADGVQVEVWDASDAMPYRRRAMAEEPGGRGLLLVEAYSSRWGTYRTRGGGKVVWATLICVTAAPKG